MQLRNAFERLIQRALVVLFCFSLGFTPGASFAQDAKAPADNRARKPNYDLASYLGHAALAGERRAFLVQLRDQPGQEVVDG